MLSIVSFILSFLWMPLIFILIGFGLGYYYFGNKAKVNSQIKAKAQEEFDKMIIAAADRVQSKRENGESVDGPGVDDDIVAN